MNRIHRRIWCTARQCWIVASELATARGKRAASSGAIVLPVVASALMAFSAAADVMPVEEDESADPGMYFSPKGVDGVGAILFGIGVRREDAMGIATAPIHSQYALTSDYLYRNSTISGDLLLMLGSRSSMSGNRSVAYGSLITAEGDNNTAIGYGVEVSRGGYATGVGARAIASGIGTTALGNDARAYSQNSIAIGSGSQTVESRAGIARIAIGGNAFAGTAGYSGAVALGGNARAEYNGVALGHHAKALAVGSVALGLDSEATESNSVSVGSSSTKRRVVNVADARLSTTSTDAVTGKQLHATNQNVTTATNMANAAKTTADQALVNTRLVTQTSASSAVRVGGDNTGTQLDIRNRSNANRKLTGVADATLSTTSTEAVAGKQLHATNTAVATARTTATAAKSVADAVSARVDAQALALGRSAVAGGSGDSASVALGGTAAAYNRDSVAVGPKARAGVGEDGEKNTGVGATSIGSGSWSANAATAIGYRARAVGNRSIAMGMDATASAPNAVALGDDAVSSFAGSLALGSGSRTTDVNQVSVGNAAVKRRIVNVNDGTLSATSSDAVTGKQLYATNTTLASVSSTATAAKTTADNALGQVTTVAGLVGQVSASGSVRLGAQNTGTVLDVANRNGAARRISNVANATLSASSTDAVTGQQLHATNTAVTAAQSTATAAKTAADSAISQVGTVSGLIGQVSANGQVRLGAANTGTVLDVSNKNGARRRIQNIANGILSASSTDAVTGQQLFASNERVGVAEARNEAQDLQLLDHADRLADHRVDLDRLRTDFDGFEPDLEGVVKFNADRTLVDLEGAVVKGVGPGDISSAVSTDAVNGGQLFATNARVDEMSQRSKFLSIGPGGDQQGASAGLISVAIGDSAESSIGSEGGVAVGAYSRASGKNSVALGRAAFVADDAESGFALGVGATVNQEHGVAIGAESRVEARAMNSVAIGYGSVARDSLTVSFGNDSLRRKLVNVGRGSADHDVTTVAQLNESLATLGGGASLDASGNIIAPTYAIQGSNHSTVGDALTALDGAVVATDARVGSLEGKLRSAFQDTTIRADGLNQLTLSGAQGAVLTNLADGRIAAGSRDAINGGQLHDVQQQLNGRMDGLEQRIDDQPQARVAANAAGAPEAPTPPAETPTVADSGNAPNAAPEAPKEPTPQVDTAELEKMLARANQYSDGISREVDRRLEKMDKRFNRMAAMNSAQSAMAMNTAGLATYNRLGAGVGYAEGESAMAVGYQRVLNDKGSATFSLNGAFTNSGERSLGVGVGIGW
ncbi:ESPR-type extended signal peptide-containing protein [Stenotrophomonas tuberculopleuritidis]|uniref:ESPR-type extended signal peptide-containing protein n=1 Tax=Stenotrophomonas tuberculopleuritidis TaxID=3055079 RepID=UPI0026E55377|nr:ESPR-type extended signal peptide-containing protein [Stenotrophomonas sp. 704A1]